MDRTQTFSAVSTSVRQLFLILRCISFAPKAEVRITREGIRFCVDEARVVQGITFLDKALFTSYDLVLESEDATELPPFEISMPALLETLQIFGLQEANYKSSGGGFSSSATNAFTTPALALAGSCRFSYSEDGAPLSITIIEGPVTTTAELNTYALAAVYDDDGTIPLDRTSLCLKTILPSSFLADAIAELSGTNPDVLLLNVSARAVPYLSLEGLGGSLGDAVVEYLADSKNEPGIPRNKKQPSITETFSVTPGPDSHGRLKTRYKFELIKKAGRAMQLASKVSVRQDTQGVLSLQFLVDSIQANAGIATQLQSITNNPLFIDYRFLPLLDEEGDGTASEDEGAEVSDD
jgi:cell cycle checkpoint protein